MAAVGDPIHEKLTLVWHNHFATSAKKVRTLKLGDFRTLAYAMLTDGTVRARSWQRLHRDRCSRGRPRQPRRHRRRPAARGEYRAGAALSPTAGG
jgi:hypothetical protein